MIEAMLYTIALLLELCGLFAVWTWSRRNGSVAWLMLGFVIILLVISSVVMFDPRVPKRAYAGFFGMYLFSALAWAWWSDGLKPVDWTGVEIAVAIVAVALFAVANA